MKYLLRGALACSLLLFAHTALAAPIVDTGAASTTPFNAWDIIDDQANAGRFKLEGSTVLTSVLGWIGGDEGARLTVSIYDQPDFLPGKALYSASFIGNGMTGWQGADSLKWALGAGNYWAVFATTSGESFMPNGAPQPLRGYAHFADGTWQNLREQSLGVRIEGFAAGGVPEPASWAMLIGGFALCGAAMRTRRANVTFARSGA